MPKEKILFCSNTLWYLKNFKSDLIEQVNKKYETHIFSSLENEKNTFNSKVYEINVNTRNINLHTIIRFIYDIFRLLYYFYKLKPKCIMIFNPIMSILTLFALRFYPLKVNTIATITGLGTFFLKHPIFYKFLIKKLYARCNVIFVQNNDDYLLINKIFQTKKIIKINGSGINTENFKFNKKREENKKITFAFCSRIINEKGVKKFVDIAMSISNIYKHDVNFLIVGRYNEDTSNIDISYLNTIKKYKFIKLYLNKKNYLDLLMRSDYLILPNFGKEGLPKVIIESLAFNIPVIASNITGNKDIIVNNQNGILIDDENEFTPVIRKIINKKIKFNMKKYGRKYIKEKYSENEITKTYLQQI
jgi:glycosyltransferase involved in cell wall biosynthesis